MGGRLGPGGWSRCITPIPGPPRPRFSAVRSPAADAGAREPPHRRGARPGGGARHAGVARDHSGSAAGLALPWCLGRGLLPEEADGKRGRRRLSEPLDLERPAWAVVAMALANGQPLLVYGRTANPWRVVSWPWPSRTGSPCPVLALVREAGGRTAVAAAVLRRGPGRGAKTPPAKEKSPRRSEPRAPVAACAEGAPVPCVRRPGTLLRRPSATVVKIPHGSSRLSVG